VAALMTYGQLAECVLAASCLQHHGLSIMVPLLVPGLPASTHVRLVTNRLQFKAAKAALLCYLGHMGL
jgi:hypothetical protein